MTAHLSLNHEPAFTRDSVQFEPLAPLHGQPRYKVTDRIGRVWLVQRDGSVQYPWRLTLLALGAQMFAVSLEKAAEIIAGLTPGEPNVAPARRCTAAGRSGRCPNAATGRYAARRVMRDHSILTTWLARCDQHAMRTERLELLADDGDVSRVLFIGALP